MTTITNTSLMVYYDSVTQAYNRVLCKNNHKLSLFLLK